MNFHSLNTIFYFELIKFFFLIIAHYQKIYYKFKKPPYFFNKADAGTNGGRGAYPTIPVSVTLKNQ